MATLPTLVPTGDSAVGSWVDNAGGTTNLFSKIDETIAGAIDTSDFIRAPNDTDLSDYKCFVADTPADFGAMTALSWQLRYALSAAPPGSQRDNYGISLRVMSGATVLAAADAVGSFVAAVPSTQTMPTAFTNTTVTAFGFVNTSATKAQWDAGSLEIRQTYTQTGSKDTHAVQVSAVQLTGTYIVKFTLTITPKSGSLTGRSADLRAPHLLIPSVKSGSLTGQSATLTYSPLVTAGIRGYWGSYWAIRYWDDQYWSAHAVAPIAPLLITMKAGTLQGRSATLTGTHVLSVAVKSGNVNGQAATLGKIQPLAITPKSGSLTGQAATLSATRYLSVTMKIGNLTALDIGATAAHLLSITLKAGSLTTSSVGLTKISVGVFALTIQAKIGTYSGFPSGLLTTVRLGITAKSGTLTGQSATLTHVLANVFTLTVIAKSGALAGQSATLTHALPNVFTLTALSKSGALQGQAVGLSGAFRLVISSKTGFLTGEAATLTLVPIVPPPPPPTLTSMTPANVDVDSTTLLTLTGTHFLAGYAGGPPLVEVFGPSGCTLGAVTVLSDTQLTVPVTVAAGAADGVRTLAVRTDDGLSNGQSLQVGELPPAPTATTTHLQQQAVRVVHLYTRRGAR